MCLTFLRLLRSQVFPFSSSMEVERERERMRRRAKTYDERGGEREIERDGFEIEQFVLLLLLLLLLHMPIPKSSFSRWGRFKVAGTRRNFPD